MKTLFTIDQGNSNPHIGIFNQNHLEKIIPFEKLESELNSHSQFDSIFSNVGKPDSHLKEIFPNGINLSEFRIENNFFDMPIHYGQTLGMDRIVSAYGVFSKLKKNEKILLIDSGTFTTVDIISEKGFMGGYIFPGFDLLLSSFNKGHLLPEITISDLKKASDFKTLPKDTKEAMIKAVELLISSPLQVILKESEINSILITGGKSELLQILFEKKTSRDYKFILEPHLIHHSLNHIFNKIQGIHE